MKLTEQEVIPVCPANGEDAPPGMTTGDVTDDGLAGVGNTLISGAVGRFVRDGHSGMSFADHGPAKPGHTTTGVKLIPPNDGETSFIPGPQFWGTGTSHCGAS